MASKRARRGARECAPLLWAIAYRMLDSVVTPKTRSRQRGWYDPSPTVPTAAQAFLEATVTPFAIDGLRAARVRGGPT